MTEQIRVLLVEDDEWLGLALSAFLQQQGFQVSLAHSLAAAMSMLSQPDLRLLIADVQLPDGCGIELCRQLCKPHIGKILISSNASEQSRVQGLGAGADDYICKPVFPQELLLRIQGLLRRLPPHAVTVPDLRFLQFRLNLENRQLCYQQHALQLSENEQQLLIKLIAHQGKIISRTELALALGETDTYLAGRALDIAISRLRKKLVQLSGQAEELLVTYRNQGYLLVQEWPDAGIKGVAAR